MAEQDGERAVDGAMRIEVGGAPALHVERMRAYIEYRAFSQLAIFASQLATVRVVVCKSADDRLTSCVISAELSDGDRIESRGCGTQPVRAVDSAVRKLADAIRKRLREL